MKIFRGKSLNKIKKGTDEILLLLIFFFVSFTLGFMAFVQNEMIGNKQITYVSKNINNQNFSIFDKTKFVTQSKKLA